MINYKKIRTFGINTEIIEVNYKELLDNKWQFLILEVDEKNYVLTKEKSFFEIDNLEAFLEKAKNDIYYKTIVEEKRKIDSSDFSIYKNYVNQYDSLMSKKIYGDKYVFGTIAVRTENGFITTIRGKENFEDYVLVHEVDHVNHTIRVSGKKAALNAPLLSRLFENKKVKAIVHFNHLFDSDLPNYEYAFPGTVRDSFRDNNSSFNIKHHGVVYLFDKEGKIL